MPQSVIVLIFLFVFLFNQQPHVICQTTIDIFSSQIFPAISVFMTLISKLCRHEHLVIAFRVNFMFLLAGKLFQLAQILRLSALLLTNAIAVYYCCLSLIVRYIKCSSVDRYTEAGYVCELHVCVNLRLMEQIKME